MVASVALSVYNAVYGRRFRAALHMVQLGFLGFMAGNASRQNGQKGGRPSGLKNDATLEREAQLERLRQRVFEAFGRDQLVMSAELVLV